MRAHATRDESAETAADPRADDFASGTSPGSDADTLTGFGDDPLIGTRVGDVLLEAVIGEGGMGRVYRGRQTHPPRAVAVKFLRHAGQTSRTDRFRREVALLGRLQHPGIARIYTAGHHRLGLEELPFFVMEFVPNAKTLLHYCNSHRLETRQRLEFFLGVCDAVATAHQQGIVHCDLKPGNILMADETTPVMTAAGRSHAKVIDFGIGKAINDTASEHGESTETGEFFGTWQYMSPEQFAGRAKEIDTRSDVYSLGVVLYQLLTGSLPYDLSNCSLAATARIVHERRPMPIAWARTGCSWHFSRQLQKVVSRCLEKNPGDRYPDAAAITADLRVLLGGRSLASRGHLRNWRAVSAAAAALATVVLLQQPWQPQTTAGATSSTNSRSATAAPFHTYRFNLHDDAWDAHVVSMEGLEWYREQTAERPCTFIRPTKLGEEGTIVMRFPAEFPIQAASLSAGIIVWTTGDPFPYDPGARASLDVSADGTTWTNLDTRGPNQGGMNHPPYDLSEVVAGSREVWVRTRLTGTQEWPNDGIIFSQFLRTQPDEFHPVFRLDLTGPQPSMLPTNTPSADPVTSTGSGPLPVAAPRPLETRTPLQ